MYTGYKPYNIVRVRRAPAYIDFGKTPSIFRYYGNLATPSITNQLNLRQQLQQYRVYRSQFKALKFNGGDEGGGRYSLKGNLQRLVS